MNKFVLAGVIALILPATAQAQNVYHFAAPANPTGGEGAKYYVPVGTPIMMRTLTQISTKDNKPGDRVYLEVAENVSFRGQIVIPVGTPVIGEVATVQRNGHFGKKGKQQIRLVEAQTPHGPVRLIGNAADEGVSGTAASVATIMLVSPLGFLIHGTSAHIAPGTPVQGQLGSDLKFQWYPSNQSAELAMPAEVASAAIIDFNF